VIVRKFLLAVGFTVTLGVVSVAIAACSSSSPPAAPDASTPIPVAKCTNGGLTVAFSPMYSAFDGKHTFQVPAVVHGSDGNVVWSADATMVRMQTDLERPNEVLITMLKPGPVIINVQTVVDLDAAVQTPPKCGSSLLTITSAQESDWEIGSARYNDGTSLHLAGAAMGNGGSPLEQTGSPAPACNNCHGEAATNSVFTDVSHTPEQTGGFSDDDLLGIIIHGVFPDGGFFDTNIVPYASWMGFHRWADITPDQQRGIIVYLRSLTPAPQKGQPNFGAFDVDSGSGPDLDATAVEEMDAPAPVDATPVDAGPPDVVIPDAGTVDAPADVETVDAADAGDAGDAN
jgi:hypothetical protein